MPSSRPACIGPTSSAVSLLTDLDVTDLHAVDEEKALLTDLACPGSPGTLAAAADGRVEDRRVAALTAVRLEEVASRLAAGTTAR